MTDINLELPYRLKPHLRMDSQTGEVVARLSPEAIEQIRQMIRDEIRQALQQSQEGGDHVSLASLSLT